MSRDEQVLLIIPLIRAAFLEHDRTPPTLEATRVLAREYVEKQACIHTPYAWCPRDSAVIEDIVAMARLRDAEVGE